jgi:hypothetical protein
MEGQSYSPSVGICTTLVEIQGVIDKKDTCRRKSSLQYANKFSVFLMVLRVDIPLDFSGMRSYLL